MTDQSKIDAFISKWGPSGSGFALNERQGAQQHFLELCNVIGVEQPTGVNDGVTDYLFEKQTLMLGERRGYADVFKRNVFAWEYKAPGKSLDGALSQLMRYAMALGNPPLLVVSDRNIIEIHTHFTGRPTERHEIRLSDLSDPSKRELLRKCFEQPEWFCPATTNKQITEQAAHAFATTAERLREKGVGHQVTSHFLTQCMFCFFAEDVGLLPARMFADLVGNSRLTETQIQRGLTSLFSSMNTGDPFGSASIEWFNGGLFETIDVPALSHLDVAALRNAAEQDWRAIDATIFGTLFERGLDPAKRSQLGAHYTDPATIMKLIEVVIRQPLMEEWNTAKAVIHNSLKKSKKQNDAAFKKATASFVGFLEHLRQFRVLDPACGSGNFLYIALRTLKDIEHLANIEAESLGLQRQVDSYTGPANLFGFEINIHAAELARVTIWIGELQWRLQHGYPFTKNPVLQSLDQIECFDALLDDEDKERQWPEASVIVGNPPFVGDKKMVGELGREYVDGLRNQYSGRVPGGADFVCYWFEKANNLIKAGKLLRAGLVATNSIRGGLNREVLKQICESNRIFAAWSDEPWVNEGAAVRVSLICFGESNAPAILDDSLAGTIFPDLTASGTTNNGADLTKAVRLTENLNLSFQGVTPSASLQKKRREEFNLPEASFNLSGVQARSILREPANVNGEPMSDVVRPYWIADDVTGRPLDRFIVNFGVRDEISASMFETPFNAVTNVRLHRAHARRNKDYPWWLLLWPRPEMFKALRGLERFIVIPRVAKHYMCAWAPAAVTPGDALIVVARDDDTMFGILQSRIHEVWARRTGTSLEDRPRYTHTSCFETFPFPDGLTTRDSSKDYENDPRFIRIASATKKLNEARDRWLNPPEWTERKAEVVLGFPEKIIPLPGHENDLKKRTLTNLYNSSPPWLRNLHALLDEAVAAAYGWEWPINDDQIIQRLFYLNQTRAL